MNTTALRLESIDKSFPVYRSLQDIMLFRKRSRIPVLRQLDLEVATGSVTAVTGPNGSGKTTLLRIITGTLVPDSGRIQVMGTDPVSHPCRTASVTGFLNASERSFYWRLSVLDNLRFFGRLQGLRGDELHRRIQAVLVLTSTENVIGQRFSTLSTGYRQRLSLARALIHDPPLLILDEPTRSLDMETARSFRRNVIDLARAHGKTILMATHNREDTDICSSIWRLDGGRLMTPEVSGG